jgi:hypothetical protein
VPPHVDAERRAATLARLVALRDAGTLSPDHVHLAAQGCAVSVGTVRQWLHEQQAGTEQRR